MANNVMFDGLEPHMLANQVADLWTAWDSGKEKWKKRVAETIQYVYATSTRETTNNQLPWSHSTHIPKLTQIHDNLAANYADALFGGSNWFSFDPAADEDLDADKRRKIEAYIATKHDQYGFVTEMKKCLNDWVQTGNAFSMIEWVRETYKKDEETLTTYVGPKLQRISPYDICFDYTARDFINSPKIIRKMLSVGDLLGMFEDGWEVLGWDAAVLKQVVAIRGAVSAAKPSDVKKEIQRSYDGFAAAADYFRSGNLEVLEFYGDILDNSDGTLYRGERITVVDRRWVLAHTKINTLNGKPMIYHCPWRRRPDNLWGMGPLDNLVGMQYLIDHLENARADAFDQLLTPDRVIVGNCEIEQAGSAKIYWIDDGNGSVHNLAPDATVLQADMQIQYKEAQMEAYAGAPREAMGIRSPGEKTKFEVSQLLNAASRLFQHKIGDFELEMVEPTIQAELEVSIVNLDAPDIARTFDDEAVMMDFIEVTKDDLVTKGKLKARGASHYAQKAVLVQELAQFQQIIAGDAGLAVHFPAQKRAELFERALGLDKYGLYQPFGGIDEQAEAQGHAQAAQTVADEMQASSEMLQEAE